MQRRTNTCPVNTAWLNCRDAWGSPEKRRLLFCSHKANNEVICRRYCTMLCFSTGPGLRKLAEVNGCNYRDTFDSSVIHHTVEARVRPTSSSGVTRQFNWASLGFADCRLDMHTRTMCLEPGRGGSREAQQACGLAVHHELASADWRPKRPPSVSQPWPDVGDLPDKPKRSAE